MYSHGSSSIEAHDLQSFFNRHAKWSYNADRKGDESDVSQDIENNDVSL